MDRPAFLTGSRVYSSPRLNSDVDVVIRVDAELLNVLQANSDPEYREGYSYGQAAAASLRFSNLNLICTTTDQKYDAWKRARDRCQGEAPCTRERAVVIHKEEGV